MSNLPKKIFEKLKSLEKKFVRFPLDDKIKKLRQKISDENDNKELVVVDKFGNRYYQYYSQHGLPTRRIVHLNMTSFNKWNDDPIMLSWLERRRLNAPSQEELEKEYIAHEEFLRKGLDWDKKERKILEEYRRKKEEAITKERKETMALGEGDTFEPGVWNRTQPLVIEDENKEVIEGGSSMPGKYISDFLEEDEIWIEKRIQEKMEPYRAISKEINWDNYTHEKMLDRMEIENKMYEENLKERKKELTNLAKRSLERKNNGTYEKFKQQYKIVINEFN